MSVDRNKLLELNRAQIVSEEDAYTVHRYRQFVTHLPSNIQSVLDVGCNTGRGGRVIKDKAHPVVPGSSTYRGGGRNLK